MRTRARKYRLEEEANVNLTPLIDVVFVILIMFIVVAPLLEIDRVDLAAGPPLAPERIQIQKSEITIHVFANNTITLNQQPVTLAQLKMGLEMAKKRWPEAHPQIFHDRQATFGTYQAVKNTVEATGFSEMDVVLKPE